MSDVTKLGALIDATAQRDAVHIAVAPVVAAFRLAPGDAIGLEAGSTDRATDRTAHPIGIVDPFLKADVEPGERFWMFLYPQTITSLRHQWTHPAFIEAPAVPHMSASEAWLREYADNAGVSYGALLDAARDKNHGGDGHRLPSDIPNCVYKELGEMWRHYEIVTGDTVTDRKAGPFWCSC